MVNIKFNIEWVITVSLKVEVARMYETPLHVYQIKWCVKSHNFRFARQSLLFLGIYCCCLELHREN